MAALTALGHATRLAAFRLRVEAGPDGRMAGEIAEALAVPGATLSFHLKELVHAGLVESENRGRNVCYRARFDAMNGLVAYLTHNCCADSSDEACAPGPAAGRASLPQRQPIPPPWTHPLNLPVLLFFPGTSPPHPR